MIKKLEIISRLMQRFDKKKIGRGSHAMTLFQLELFTVEHQI